MMKDMIKFRYVIDNTICAVCRKRVEKIVWYQEEREQIIKITETKFFNILGFV